MPKKPVTIGPITITHHRGSLDLSDGKHYHIVMGDVTPEEAIRRVVRGLRKRDMDTYGWEKFVPDLDDPDNDAQGDER
jgi:hypothetical protein